MLCSQPGDETPVDLFLDDILDNDEDKYEEYIKVRLLGSASCDSYVIDELRSFLEQIRDDPAAGAGGQRLVYVSNVRAMCNTDF